MMPTWIALLRGVNVGGRNRLPMAALREQLETEGWGPVQTYIQSGNVILHSRLSRTRLAERLAQCLNDSFGIQAPVALLNRKELRELLQDHPFGNCPEEQRFVTVLARAPAAAQSALLKPSSEETDDYWLRGRLVYVRCRAGYADTPWSNLYFERQLKLPATSRNWRTLQKLAALAD